MSVRTLGNNITRIKFKNNHVVYENFTKCTIKDYEFNLSYNPTLLSGSQAILVPYSSSISGSIFYNPTGSEYYGTLKNEFTSSDFSPYVSTVGLYNDAQELLAVAKMSAPMPVADNTDMTFLIKWDTQWIAKPYFTPSVTPTATPSVTPSVTPNLSPSPTVTVTPSISVSTSVTPSISVSPSTPASPSVTPTVTPSVTPSISVSMTPSVTPSLTATPSVSPSQTVASACYTTTFGSVPVSGGAGSFATGNITVSGGSINVWAKYNSGGTSSGVAGFGMNVNSIDATGTFTIISSGQTGYSNSSGTADGYITLSPGTYSFTLTKSDNLTSGNNVKFSWAISSVTDPTLSSDMSTC